MTKLINLLNGVDEDVDRAARLSAREHVRDMLAQNELIEAHINEEREVRQAVEQTQAQAIAKHDATVAAINEELEPVDLAIVKAMRMKQPHTELTAKQKELRGRIDAADMELETVKGECAKRFKVIDKRIEALQLTKNKDFYPGKLSHPDYANPAWHAQRSGLARAYDMLKLQGRKYDNDLAELRAQVRARSHNATCDEIDNLQRHINFVAGFNSVLSFAMSEMARLEQAIADE